MEQVTIASQSSEGIWNLFLPTSVFIPKMFFVNLCPDITAEKKTLTFIILAFLIIVILLQLLLFSVSSEIYLALFALILGTLVFIVLPIVQANLLYKRTIELHHEPITASTMFFDDHFVSTAQPSNATITVKYDQVKRVIGTKQLYLLVVRLQLFYIIDKNGFDKINMVEFEKFIKEKAPKAKFQL